MRAADRMALKAAVALALAAGFAATGEVRPAAAFPPAEVENRIDPDFLRLLRPKRPHPHGPGAGGTGEGRTVTVDCSGNTRGAFTSLQKAVDSGARTIRITGAQACPGPVVVSRPVTITGDGANPAPVFSGPGSCFSAAGAGDVLLQNLAFANMRGLATPCISASSTRLSLDRVVIDSRGGGPAVSANAGGLSLRDVQIEAANHSEPAVRVQRGPFWAERSAVYAGGGDGIHVQGASDLTIEQVTVTGSGQTGILVLGDRSGAEARIVRAAIAGFGTGIALRDTALAIVTDGAVCGSDTGIAFERAKAFVNGMTLDARTAGVLVRPGSPGPTITENWIFGIQDAERDYASAGIYARGATAGSAFANAIYYERGASCVIGPERNYDKDDQSCHRGNAKPPAEVLARCRG